MPSSDPVAVPAVEGTVAVPTPLRRVPALGHGVPVVDVALECQGHLLLELVDEVPLGDAGVVWGRRAGRRPSAGPRGRPTAAAPVVPTWREEQHGLE